jgi:hypothetical protein
MSPVWKRYVWKDSLGKLQRKGKFGNLGVDGKVI